MITNKNTLSLDKFYTNPDIVKICYYSIKKHLDINKNDISMFINCRNIEVKRLAHYL